MKVSYDWLKELLPELKKSPELIMRRLTDAGIEVEEVHSQAQALEGVIVGEVRDLTAHPQSDRLRIARVYDGAHERQVVCGAPNVAAGQKVAFAPVGTRLPNGLVLERRAIRGTESEGMICSEAELGLGVDQSGILVLPGRARAGKSIAPHVGRTDFILEVSPTPNRSDVLSHHGLVRELAALFGLPPPKTGLRVKERGDPASMHAKIDIRAGQRCPRYVARVIRGVKVGPSPESVRRRLESLGVRPISNVVDATNLVLHELGHPLHAFDLKKLEGAKVIVRLAKAGETITTLDEVERKLTEDDLVIADAEHPIALAGVMGGRDSEVDGSTVDILLESAMFDPRSIRRTAKRLGLHTEASHRFERGADPRILELAVDRAAMLITELAGGDVLPGRIEVIRREHKAPIVSVRPSRATLLLGRPVTKKEIVKTLAALGLRSTKAPTDEERRPRGERPKKKPELPKETLHFSVPSWRHDIEREVDLIEEVARVAGFGLIPTLMPPMPARIRAVGIGLTPIESTRRALVGAGFYEAVSLAFSSRTQIEAMGGDPAAAVEVENPLGEESGYLRTSMLPSLLKAAVYNQEQARRTDLRIFEIGRSFEWRDSRSELPFEAERVGILLRGRRFPAGWASGSEITDVFDLKGALERLLHAFSVDEVTVELDDAPWLHPASASGLWAVGGGRRLCLARFGELHPDVAERFGLEGPSCFVAEVELEMLALARGPERRFRPESDRPPVLRDLAFFVDRSVPSDRVLRETRQSAGPLLESCELFDVYEGRGVPEGQRSLALRLSFRAEDRTLTAAEIEAVEARIKAHLAKDVGARLRDG